MAMRVKKKTYATFLGHMQKNCQGLQSLFKQILLSKIRYNNSTARSCSPRCTGFSHVEPVSGCIVPYMRLSILFFDRFIKKGKT